MRNGLIDSQLELCHELHMLFVNVKEDIAGQERQTLPLVMYIVPDESYLSSKMNKLTVKKSMLIKLFFLHISSEIRSLRG